jgi:hypothetical protein
LQVRIQRVCPESGDDVGQPVDRRPISTNAIAAQAAATAREALAGMAATRRGVFS